MTSEAAWLKAYRDRDTGAAAGDTPFEQFVQNKPWNLVSAEIEIFLGKSNNANPMLDRRQPSMGSLDLTDVKTAK